MHIVDSRMVLESKKSDSNNVNGWVVNITMPS